MTFRSILSLALLVILSAGLCPAQSSTSPYRLSPAVDVPLGVVGVSTLTTSFVLHKRKPLLTEADIAALNTGDILRFDRGATQYWNTRAAHWSDALMFTAIGMPATLLAGEPSRKDFGRASLIYAEAFLLNAGLTALTKNLVKRKRPYVYNPNAPLDKKLERDATSSFFSGHTSTTACMSFLFANMYTDYYPDGRLKPLVWFGAAVLPLATGILRYRAGKHFWTDIIVGYVVGASVGSLVPALHRRR